MRVKILKKKLKICKKNTLKANNLIECTTSKKFQMREKLAMKENRKSSKITLR